MPTLRIYDVKNHILMVYLHGLLRLLAPPSLKAVWTISTVASANGMYEWFDANGEGGEEFEKLMQEDAKLSGNQLAALANKTRQVIWGEFSGFLPTKF